MEKVAEHDTKKPVHGRSGDTVYGIAALLSGGALSLYLPRKRLSRLAKASVFLPGRAKLTDSRIFLFHPSPALRIYWCIISLRIEKGAGGEGGRQISRIHLRGSR